MIMMMKRTLVKYIIYCIHFRGTEIEFIENPNSNQDYWSKRKEYYLIYFYGKMGKYVYKNINLKKFCLFQICIHGYVYFISIFICLHKI